MDEEIRTIARAIAEVKPHQVMMPVGFEPDLYVAEGEPSEDKLRGTIEDYQNTWRRFNQLFKEEGADNAVWVMDYSWNIRDKLDLAA